MTKDSPNREILNKINSLSNESISIDKKKLLRVASESKELRRALGFLCPELIEKLEEKNLVLPSKHIDLSHLSLGMGDEDVFDREKLKMSGINRGIVLRLGGEYANKAFLLSNDCGDKIIKWELIKENGGWDEFNLLVPRIISHS